MFHPLKNILVVSQKLNRITAIPMLGVYKSVKTSIKIMCTPIFITLFTIAKKGDNNQQMNKQNDVYSNNGIFNTKRNVVLMHAIT